MLSHPADWLNGSGGRTVFFIDPARRDASGNKVFCIEDCEPDLSKLQDTLLDIGHTVIVKLSPMLDITQALRTLRNVGEVHVVSVKGECKELLFVMHREPPATLTCHCVNLETEDEDFVMDISGFKVPEFKSFKVSEFQGGAFLFEPNASILKAGLQDAFAARYDLQKLHPNSNLFVGTDAIDSVPARQFQVVGISDFSKTGLKTLLKDVKQANLTVRNFPSTTAELRRRLKLKEGGSDYLFATTLLDGVHVLIRCVKA